MLANLNRQNFIDLLNKLGDPNDDEVIAAARDLSAQVVVSGLTWDDLLSFGDRMPGARQSDRRLGLLVVFTF